MTLRWLLCALAAVSLPAYAADDFPVHRNRDGTINYAPRPGTFVVVDVDTYYRVVRLRSRDGATADVRVPEGAHDLDELKPGDVVQVDFLVPNDDGETELTAATVWPLR